ncbi:MAG: sugar phosphate isomerase/epimerase [Planctomycetota bacterium]|nr:sugar phosphate isomerase/epimerase [Planctomycetota bacterium]
MFTAMHSWSFRDRFKTAPGFTIFDCLDQTAAMGFSGIEIMAGAAGSPAGDLGSDEPTHLDRVMKHAAKRGVKVLSLATYNDFAFVGNEEWRLANIAYIKRWLGIAGMLGVPNIRMLTGNYNDKAPRAKLEQLTRDAIRECVPHAEKAGVNMAIENHNSIFLQADEILGLIADVGSVRLTACPDPTNWSGKEFWEPQCPPEVREQVFGSAAKLASRATQSHLKVKGAPVNGKLAGFGDDLLRLLRSYKKAGYDGGIAFESIGDGDLLAPMPQAREAVEAAISKVNAEARR